MRRIMRCNAAHVGGSLDSIIWKSWIGAGMGLDVYTPFLFIFVCFASVLYSSREGRWQPRRRMTRFAA